MIDYINGKIIVKNPAKVILESGGIGFDIHITLPAYENLPEQGHEAKLAVHFYVKENPFAYVLYGFADERERECFRQIISVSGIGPKTAMTILSAIKYDDFMSMVSGGNYLPLTSVSGVGRKTAERLVVELKEKIGKSLEASSSSADGTRFGQLSKASEVIQALLSLGYNRLEADKMLKNVNNSSFSELSVEEIIREVLKGS